MQRWGSKFIGALALASGSLTLLASVPSAHAEVTYRESVRNFEIGARIRTRRDVWQAIRHDGVVGTSLINAVGSATWRVRPKWWWKQPQAGRCTIDRVTAKVDVLIRVPIWQFAHRAAPHVQRYYNCYRKTVMTHERRHGEIAREIGHAVRDALLAEVRDVPCAVVNERASEVFRREIRAGRRRQKAFDAADYKRPRYQRCNRISQPPKRQATRNERKPVQRAPAPQPKRELREVAAVPSPVAQSVAENQQQPAPDIPSERLALVVALAFGAAWWVQHQLVGR